MAAPGACIVNSIQLHGELYNRFGDIPALDIASPAEAIRALSCQLDGFDNVIRSSEWYVVLEGDEGKFALDPTGMQLGMDAKTLHIVPRVEGAASAKGKGGVKMVLGVALIGASLIVPGMQGFGLAAAKGAWAAKIAGTGISFGHMALAGIAMTLGGSALLMAPQPAMPSADEKPDTNSFIFNGNNSPSGQGMVVPCVWGEFRAVPIPVATRIETNQIGIGGGTGGSVGGNAGYTNYPPGFDPSKGISPEEYVMTKLVAPWADI